MTCQTLPLNLEHVHKAQWLHFKLLQLSIWDVITLRTHHLKKIRPLAVAKGSRDSSNISSYQMTAIVYYDQCAA